MKTSEVAEKLGVVSSKIKDYAAMIRKEYPHFAPKDSNGAAVYSMKDFTVMKFFLMLSKDQTLAKCVEEIKYIMLDDQYDATLTLEDVEKSYIKR